MFEQNNLHSLDTKMIRLSCWAQRWSVKLRIFASVVQLCTHSIDEATNSPALADGLAHGITGQTTNNDDYENKCELELLWMAADLAGKISSHKSSSKLNLK
jgi:hypothetical protein